MRKIRVSAISDKANCLLGEEIVLPKKNKLAIKVLEKMGGYKEKVICISPFVAEYYFERAPRVFEQLLSEMLFKIDENLTSKGLKRGEDFLIEVVNE